jgi:hypothetical protein
MEASSGDLAQICEFLYNFKVIFSQDEKKLNPDPLSTNLSDLYPDKTNKVLRSSRV